MRSIACSWLSKSVTAPSAVSGTLRRGSSAIPFRSGTNPHIWWSTLRQTPSRSRSNAIERETLPRTRSGTTSLPAGASCASQASGMP